MKYIQGRNNTRQSGTGNRVIGIAKNGEGMASQRKVRFMQGVKEDTVSKVNDGGRSGSEDPASKSRSDVGFPSVGCKDPLSKSLNQHHRPVLTSLPS